MKLGIIGWYGHSNLGDERILYCLKKNFSHHDIVVFHGLNDAYKRIDLVNKCDYVLKTGKNKGKSCDSYGYYYNDNCYCKRHHSIKQVTKPLKLTCKCLLKTGKRKGEECGSKIHEGEYCKRHSKISST